MSKYLDVLHEMASVYVRHVNIPSETADSEAKVVRLNKTADTGLSLHQIGKHCDTDKWLCNRTGCLSYLQIYELYFERMRDKKIDLLEIGVRAGHSIDLWKRYFADAGNIYGIDIEESAQGPFVQENTHFIHSDATKSEVLEHFDEQQSFDIIIDDGSHINKDIISSFEIFWPRLKSKGVYVIEDLYNSYGPSATTLVPVPGGDGREWVPKAIPHVPISSSPPPKPADPEIEQILGGSRGIEQNNREQLREWLNQIEKNLNNPQQDILYIHHWDSIIIIGKT